MTARKKVASEPKPVTVAELLLALASYPQDAEVHISDPYVAIMIRVEGDPIEEYHSFWEPMETTSIVASRPQHYQRPDIVERVVHRSEPMDDFAAAQEFLEWLQGQHYGMPRESTGGGHNEPTTYRDLTPSELAHEYAQREQS